MRLWSIGDRELGITDVYLAHPTVSQPLTDLVSGHRQYVTTWA